MLPHGFKKVRYYGFLNPTNKVLLLRLQYMLGTVEPKEKETETENEIEIKPKKPCCPVCGKEMILFKILLPMKMIDAIKEQVVPP